MSEPEFRFTAPVISTGDIQFVQHYLPVPLEIADELQSRGIRRLVGTLNGQPFNLALRGRHDGERYLVLSRQTLRSLKARAGDPVTAIFRPDPTPDQVELPEELAEVLHQEPEAAQRFFAMTPGRQRSLVHYVTTAKRVDTRITRALDLANKLKTNTLYGDLNPDRR